MTEQEIVVRRKSRKSLWPEKLQAAPSATAAVGKPSLAGTASVLQRRRPSRTFLVAAYNHVMAAFEAGIVGDLEIRTRTRIASKKMMK